MEKRSGQGIYLPAIHSPVERTSIIALGINIKRFNKIIYSSALCLPDGNDL
jgi:hypothetical protein